MKRLYEWSVATETTGARRVGPVGVTDRAQRARDRMLEALAALPPGVRGTGWVTDISYAPSADSYERYGPTVLVSRDVSGSVLWIAGGDSD